MKQLHLITSLSFLAIFATPAAIANTVLPNLYAKQYCDWRMLGASKDDATRLSLQESSISGDEWTYVTLSSGKQYRSDLMQAAIAVGERCPQFLK